MAAREPADSESSGEGDGERLLDRRTVSVPPVDEDITTDAVIDAIALIESQRQDLKREPDPQAWRKRALDVLGDLLRRIDEASRLHGPSAERHANAEAVRNAIGRVKAGAGVATSAPPGRKREAVNRRRGPGPRGPAGGRPIGRRSGR